MEVEANGKTFTVPDGTTNEQIGEVIDYYFSSIANAEPDVPSPVEVGKSADQIIAERPGTFDFVTGNSRMTPDMENLQEVGNAPELNQMYGSDMGASFKSSLAPMITGDTADLKSILKSQWGDRVDFRDDEKGNIIVKFPSGEYALNKPGFTAQDTARGLLELLTFGKGAAMAQGGKSWLRRAGKQALAAGTVEAANEASDTALGGTFDPVDVGVATGFGGGGQMLGDSVGAIYRNFKNAIKSAPDALPPLPNDMAARQVTERAALEEFNNLVERNGYDQTVAVYQQLGKRLPNQTNPSSSPMFESGQTDAIVAAGKELDVPIMTSDVMQPKNFASKSLEDLTSKVPFIGTAGQRTAQQQARENAVDTFTSNYSGNTDQGIIDSLKNARSATKNEAGRMFKEVQDNMDAVALAEPNGFSVDRVINMIDTNIRKLSAEGVIPDEVAIQKMITLRRALTEAPQNFSSLQKNRTRFREMVAEIDPTARSQMSTNAKRLADKVDRKLSEILDATVEERSTSGFLPATWKRANDMWGEVAVDMQSTRLKNVLDKGDITPETYKNLLFSNKSSEVRTLYKNLTPNGRLEARDAIINKITSTLEGRAGGGSPDMFVTEMRKNRKAIEVFFQGDDRRAIDGLFKVLDATKGAQSASLRTPTGQAMLLPTAAIGGVMLPGSATIPLVSAIFSRKLYNTPAVRDLLIKINKSTSKEVSQAAIKRLLSITEDAVLKGGPVAQAVQGTQLEN